jgi:hypothetical protein
MLGTQGVTGNAAGNKEIYKESNCAPGNWFANFLSKVKSGAVSVLLARTSR